jgi:2-polyprenyl-3-methyl-5-hydroxy-6-metoxy-1,4-benzoquinol methylase
MGGMKVGGELAVQVQETTACNLCGSQESEWVRTTQDQQYDLEGTFSIVQCKNCQLVYVNPRPNEEDIRVYYPEQQQIDIRHLLQWAQQNPITRLGIRMILHRRSPPFVPGGKLLEIGCANGAYLTLMRNAGWNVYGIEIEAAAARYAREELSLNVRNDTADVALADFPDNHFEAVTMWHVLEHMYDPSAVLAEIYRVLKPGGVFMLEVPNVNSLPASWFGEVWFPLEIPRHLYHFTPQTLTAMLTKGGFRLTKLKGVPAAEAMVRSMLLLWHKWRGHPRGTPYTMKPALMALCFPMSWLMAKFCLSDHMMAVGVKPLDHAATS